MSYTFKYLHCRYNTLQHTEEQYRTKHHSTQHHNEDIWVYNSYNKIGQNNKEKKEEPTKLRVFYNQSSTNTYQPTRVLVRNEDSYKELLMQARAELRAFKNKYKMLTELEDIFSLID